MLFRFAIFLSWLKWKMGSLKAFSWQHCYVAILSNWKVYSRGCPGTNYENKASLEFIYSPCFCFLSSGIKCMHCHVQTRPYSLKQLHYRRCYNILTLLEHKNLEHWSGKMSEWARTWVHSTHIITGYGHTCISNPSTVCAVFWGWLWGIIKGSLRIAGC